MNRQQCLTLTTSTVANLLLLYLLYKKMVYNTIGYSRQWRRVIFVFFFPLACAVLALCFRSCKRDGRADGLTTVIGPHAFIVADLESVEDARDVIMMLPAVFAA